MTERNILSEFNDAWIRKHVRRFPELHPEPVEYYVNLRRTKLVKKHKPVDVKK